jgi:magnesium transporter
MPKTKLSNFLVDTQGSHTEVDRALVERHLSEAEFFWLDLYRPDAEALSMLRDLFQFHPLSVEDARHFGQRPKFEEFDDFVFLVVFGANADKDGLVEVHCFLSDNFLVTVHHDDCPPFEELRQRAASERVPGSRAAMILYAVVDALVDSFFPEMARLDDRIDQLENGVVQKPDDAQLQEIFRLKRRLVTWRKVITPERDLFTRLVTGVAKLPGMTAETERYYRDVYDHLIRISDLVDSYRDLLTGAMDVYLSTVSNRLNEVMKRLTIVATVFMPLTWITGFFGMNFGRLVLNITGWPAFLIFGLATQVAAVIAMIIVFRRRGWM